MIGRGWTYNNPAHKSEANSNELLLLSSNYVRERDTVTLILAKISVIVIKIPLGML